MIIEKSKDRFADNDYKLMSKNSKAMHILYCESIFHCKSAKEIWDYLYYLYGTNEIFSDLGKSKIEFLEDGFNEEVENINAEQVDLVAINKNVQNDSYEDRINQEYRQYIEVIYTCDNFVQNPLDVDFYDQFMKLDEDDKKKKDLCYSSTFQSGKCKIKSKLEFSKEDLHPISHILDDTPSLQLLIILDCDTKFTKCLNVKKKEKLYPTIISCT